MWLKDTIKCCNFNINMATLQLAIKTPIFDKKYDKKVEYCNFSSNKGTLPSALNTKN